MPGDFVAWHLKSLSLFLLDYRCYGYTCPLKSAPPGTCGPRILILRRITEHVQAQNWTAIVLDLVIVVVGVFIGIQVSNWNDARVARAEETEFVRSIRDDIEQDIADVQGFVEMLSDVSGHGYQALESLESETACEGNCWNELLSFFHASQWIDVITNPATFDEIKRTGLPRDAHLRDTLARYYGLADQYTIINSSLPEYRELVRSVVPIPVQDHMWNQCVDIAGRQQILIDDCAAPIGDDEARAIVEVLRHNPGIKPSLTFWLSTVSIVAKTLRSQVSEGEQMIVMLDEHIGK